MTRRIAAGIIAFAGLFTVAGAATAAAVAPAVTASAPASAPQTHYWE